MPKHVFKNSCTFSSIFIYIASITTLNRFHCMFYIVKNSPCQNSDFCDRSCTWFLNYCFAKCLEILTTGSLEIDSFLQKQSVSIFRATAHALHLTGFWVTKKAKNCWVLCVVSFHNISL